MYIESGELAHSTSDINTKRIVAVLIYPKAAHETINEERTIENKGNTINGTREWHSDEENNKHTI